MEVTISIRAYGLGVFRPGANFGEGGYKQGSSIGSHDTWSIRAQSSSLFSCHIGNLKHFWESGLSWSRKHVALGSTRALCTFLHGWLN